MKTTMITAAATAAFLSAGAVAQPYVGAGFGIANYTDPTTSLDLDIVFFGLPQSQSDEASIDLSTGAALKLFLGYNFNDVLGVELERSARAAVVEDTDDNTIATALTAVNLVLTVPTNGRVVPYLAAGVGYANIDSDYGNFDDFDGSMAFQAKAGVLFPFATSHAIGIETSYVDNGTFEFEQSINEPDLSGTARYETELDTFDVTLNYRFQFGGFGK